MRFWLVVSLKFQLLISIFVLIYLFLHLTASPTTKKFIVLIKLVFSSASLRLLGACIVLEFCQTFVFRFSAS